MPANDERSQLLARLRSVASRIRLMAVAEGLVCMFAGWLPAVVLIAAIDWTWDRFEEIPGAGRLALTAAFYGSLAFLARRFLYPRLAPPKPVEVASLVERRWPELDFRLVTATQVEGGSAFSERVTLEASEISARQEWNHVVDSLPLRRSLAVLLPVALVFAGMWAYNHRSAPVLASRLAWLADNPIPRSTTIESASDIHAPQGEPVQLVLAWKGEVPATGYLRWRGIDGQRLDIPLDINDGQLLATLPSEAGDGVIRAWAGDGRVGPIPLHRQARPVPVLSSARAVLPAWRGLTPSGSRFSLELADGEAEALPGSDIEVEFEAGTPLSGCQVSVIPQSASAESRTETGRVDGSKGSVRFTLAGTDSRYEIQAASREGLSSRPPLIRRCKPLPEDTPQVAWLPEHLPESGISTEEDLEGLPVVIGTQFRVAYRASSQAGIGRAEFHYRIVNKTGWRVIRLSESANQADWGAFDTKKGLFSKRPARNFDFYPLPSTEPEKIPGRADAWGRFDFHIESLSELRIADRIEYKVVAHDLRPQPLAGESETRVKEVVGVDELLAWLRRREREQEKLRQLRLDQLGVFPDRPATRSGS